MKKLTGPIIGLHFTRNYSVVIDTTHGLILFHHLTMQVKTASSETAAKHPPVLTDDALMIKPRTAKTITAFVDHPSEWNTTGTVTPLEKFTETASLLISLSMLTIFDNEVPVRVINAAELPNLVRKNTQIAEFSIVNPEQSKYFKPVDMATLSMIPQGDLYLITYLHELHETNKPDQKNNTFRSLTPGNPGKPEDHTPIQTQNLRNLVEVKK